VGSAPDWQQLGYNAAHLAIVLGLILLFLYCVGWLFGKTTKECTHFLKLASKAEFTQLSGVFDLGMFLILCVFIYSHALTELVFTALGLEELSSDPHLWNADAKTLVVGFCFVVSVVFVGLVYLRKQPKP